MKHYVLGFLFNKDASKVLLALKNSPSWQAGKWNGIGGKVEDDDSSPTNTIYREGREEIGINFNGECDWQLKITYICKSGTVFVFSAFVEDIIFDTLLKAHGKGETNEIYCISSFLADELPKDRKLVGNIKLFIEICRNVDIISPVVIQSGSLI